VLIVRLALRNLVRHYRRSLITLTSITLGVALVLWIQGILEGQSRNIIDTVARAQLGHIQILKEDYFKNRTLNQTLSTETTETLNHAIAEFAPNTPVHVVKRVYLPMIASTGDSSLTLQLIGIDAAAEAKATRIKDNLKEGNYLAPAPAAGCEDRELLLSKAAAEALGVLLGDKVVFLGQNVDGTMANDLLRVTGLFDTGSRDFDRSVAYTSLTCAKSLLGKDGVHEIALILDQSDQTDMLQNKLLGIFPPAEIRVATWRESIPRINAVVNYNHAMSLLIMVIFFVVLGLGIANTFLVSVFERTKEFGMMMAIGVFPSQVLIIVLIEAVGVTITAASAGIAIGFSALLYHYHYGFDTRFLLKESLQVGNFRIDPMIYPALEVGIFIQALAVLVLFALLAAIYPAYKASRMNPLEALRS
jgi:putative ABC transport system permease protein